MLVNLTREHIDCLNVAIEEQAKIQASSKGVINAMIKNNIEQIDKIREALELTGSVLLNEEDFNLVRPYLNK